MRKRYIKKIAATLTTAVVVQPSVMSLNLNSINAFAAYENQEKEKVKVKIIEKGTELISSIEVDFKGITTDAAVILNSDVQIEVEPNKDTDYVALDIRDELAKYDNLDVKVVGEDFELYGDIALKNEDNPQGCGWNIMIGGISEDEDDADYDYDESLATLRVSTLKSEIEDCIIPPFSYEKIISLIIQPDNEDETDNEEDEDNKNETDNPEKPQLPGQNPEKPAPETVKLASLEIKGTTITGNILSAEVKDADGNNANSKVSYRWYRKDKVNAISEVLVGTEPTYKLQDSDAYKYIKLVVADSSTTLVQFTGQISKKSTGSSGGGSSSSRKSSKSSTENNTESTALKTENGISNNNVAENNTFSVQKNTNGQMEIKDSKGNPVTGWQQIGGKWYLGDSNGQAMTGWQQVSGKWYLMNTSGEMTTGWQQVNGKWYYLNKDGSMAVNTYVDGYYVGNDGAFVN